MTKKPVRFYSTCDILLVVANDCNYVVRYMYQYLFSHPESVEVGQS